MKTIRSRLITAGVLCLLVTGANAGLACPPDSVEVGPVCVDKYEASVWEIPATKTLLINKVKNGRATLANLAAGGGIIQHGTDSNDYGSGCPDTGNGCTDFYAVSIAGVRPARFITWFQAVAACRNAGKRLLTNE